MPEEWYSILDSAGAQALSHKDIARLLNTKHDVSPWWSQHLTVEYERARGMRARYETPRGFQVSASKTMGAPVSAVYEAFANGELREGWLPGAPLTIRKDTPLKSTRAVWDDSAGAATTVNFNYYERGADRSQITVQHSKLSDAAEVEARREYWKAAFERLDTRKGEKARGLARLATQASRCLGDVFGAAGGGHEGRGARSAAVRRYRSSVGHGVEASIDALPGKQLMMRADLRNLAVFHYDDA